MSVWYCTREEVTATLDVEPSARADAQVDRAIAAASRSVEALCHRRFYPQSETRYFNWPNAQGARSWRLWLDQNDVIQVDTLTSGGTTIAAADYFLEPVNGGPPYTHIEVDLDSNATFSGGDTHQQSIAITGLWGYQNDEEPAGTLDGAVTDSATTITVTDSSTIGVGSVLRVGDERLIVTARGMVDTGQGFGDSMTASKADVSIGAADGTAYTVGEVILRDSERMLITDISGNTLTVVRAWQGTVLAAHTDSAIFAPRRLTVTRGALGTTAAAHSDGDAIHRWQPPGPVNALAVAEATNTLLQAQSGYMRTIRGGGSSQREATLEALKSLREQVYTSHGRKARIRGV